MDIRLRTSRENEQGSVLVLVAVCITLFMLFLALTIDFGLMIQKKGQLQNVADAAALAAAQELVDEDLLTSGANQSDDIVSARNYAEMYAASNITDFNVDRNSENIESGGVLVGYIDDPMDMTSPLRTSDVSNYNSVKVTASMTNELNGPLQLFFGGVTGVNNIEMQASSVATIENRILGFKLVEGESLPMLPFAIYEDSWNDAFDGVSDFDQYSVDDASGIVTSGSDGVPEFVFAPWFPNQGIPGYDGNGRTLFLTDSPTIDALKNQIYNGVAKSDLESSNVNGMVLDDNGLGQMSKWIPGEQWMHSSWNTALNNIKGETRIVALFNDIAEGSGSQESYKISGFQAVKVCEAIWPNKQKQRRVYLQPAQMISSQAVVHSMAPQSSTIYALAISR
ncbi:MAG: pilus assembly protein [Candidatus Omnitrophica bacterium]|nr:pilus assembly protein [Candidatus Omnitrophota bacterium]